MCDVGGCCGRGAEARELQFIVQDSARHSKVPETQCSKQTLSVHRSDSFECFSCDGDLQTSSYELFPPSTCASSVAGATYAQSPTCSRQFAGATMNGTPVSVSMHPLPSTLLASSAVNESLYADIESLQKALLASAERQCTLLALQHSAVCLERAQAPKSDSPGHPGRASLSDLGNLGSLPLVVGGASPVRSPQATREDVEVHINPLYSAEVAERGHVGIEWHAARGTLHAMANSASEDGDKCVVGSSTPCSTFSTAIASPSNLQPLEGESKLLRICGSTVNGSSARPVLCQASYASGMETPASDEVQEPSRMSSPFSWNAVSIAPLQDERPSASGVGTLEARELEIDSSTWSAACTAANKVHGAGANQKLGIETADTPEAVAKLCEDLHGLHARIASNLQVGTQGQRLWPQPTGTPASLP